MNVYEVLLRGYDRRGRVLVISKMGLEDELPEALGLIALLRYTYEQGWLDRLEPTRDFDTDAHHWRFRTSLRGAMKLNEVEYVL